MKTFGWDLCHRCNYQCPYCGVWKDHPELDVILSPEKWGKIWNLNQELLLDEQFTNYHYRLKD